MSLTERERKILQLSKQGLSDYRIARKIDADPPSVTRSRKNACKKILNSVNDVEWAIEQRLSLEPDFSINQALPVFSFFL